MLANRADLDVYVWAQVGKGLEKLKTAQNIDIISHLATWKNMSTQLPFKECAPEWGCFQNLPVYQKSVPNTLKAHIYLYHWAAQVESQPFPTNRARIIVSYFVICLCRNPRFYKQKYCWKQTITRVPCISGPPCYKELSGNGHLGSLILPRDT